MTGTFMTLIGFGPNMASSPFAWSSREQASAIYTKLKESGDLNPNLAPKPFESGIAIPTYTGERNEEFATSPKKPDPRRDLRMAIPIGVLPQKWQKIGDLVLFPEGSFAGRKDIDWQAVAFALKVERIGLQATIAEDSSRRSKAILLYGDEGDVEHYENGVCYVFDPFQVMFSSGNITERIRMGTVQAKDEIIVDAYAGIGYYTLPFLTMAGAAQVHACEMTPASIEGLVRGLSANAVEEKCTIHQGDNQTTMPKLKGIADRIILGLLPSSEKAWPLASDCLKPEGGIIHVHMNIHNHELETWPEQTKEYFADYSQRKTGIMHLEIVKSYSPGISHVVLDLKMGPLAK
jgi:tRNA wybutosine-synthesizing protein 3